MSGFLNIFGKNRGSSSKEDKEKGSKGGNIINIGIPTNVVHGIHVSKNNITGDLEGLPKQWQRVMDQLITTEEQQENPDAVYSAVKFYNYSIKKKDQLEPFKPFITEEAINEESAEIENYMTKTHYKSEDSLGKSSTNSSEDNFKEFEENRPALPLPLPLPDVAPLVPPRESPSPPPPIPEKRPTTLPPKPKLMPKPKILSNNNHNSQNSHGLGGQKKKLNDLSKPLDDLSKISCIEAVSPLKTSPVKKAEAVADGHGPVVLEEEEDDGELILREKDQSTRKRVPKTDEEVYAELRTICNLEDPTLRYQTKVEVRVRCPCADKRLSVVLVSNRRRRRQGGRLMTGDHNQRSSSNNNNNNKSLSCTGQTALIAVLRMASHHWHSLMVVVVWESVIRGISRFSSFDLFEP